MQVSEKRKRARDEPGEAPRAWEPGIVLFISRCDNNYQN